MDMVTGDLFKATKNKRKPRLENEIIAKETIDLSSRAEIVYHIETDCDYMGTLLFELGEMLKREYGEQDAVVQIRNQRIPIRLLNTYVKNRKIEENTYIGKVTPIIREELVASVRNDI